MAMTKTKEITFQDLKASENELFRIEELQGHVLELSGCDYLDTDQDKVLQGIYKTLQDQHLLLRAGVQTAYKRFFKQSA